MAPCKMHLDGAPGREGGRGHSLGEGKPLANLTGNAVVELDLISAHPFRFKKAVGIDYPA